MTMKLNLLIFYKIRFVLLLLFCIDFMKSEFLAPYYNVTMDGTTQKSGRLKRSPIEHMPLQLKINIQNEIGEIKNLIFMRVERFVADENLPVVLSVHNRKLNIMDDVGKFVAYYDERRCSAIVFFEKLNAFYGVIGTNYYVECLPYDFDDNGNYRLQEVGEPYIKKRQSQSNHIDPNQNLPGPSDMNSWEDYLRPPNFLPQVQNNVTDVDPNNRHSWRRQHYYSESLVFVAQDIVRIFMQHFGANQYIEWLVRYYIIYFHAVDMMFKKISSTQGSMHINIAKIIIEDNSALFNFLSSDALQFNEVTRRMYDYLYMFKFYYPVDSFDHVFIHTSHSIWDESVLVNGITKYGANLLEARKNDQFHYAVPITIMGYQSFYGDYMITVHELGRIFDMNIDPGDRGLKAIGQCYGVMQRGGPACDSCLTWSERSILRFNAFLKTNINRCFLINYPRSLAISRQNLIISPQKQCQCYGYNFFFSHDKGVRTKYLNNNECGKLLTCIRINEQSYSVERTILPLDGTSCKNKKICWNYKCVFVGDV